MHKESLCDLESEFDSTIFNFMLECSDELLESSESHQFLSIVIANQPLSDEHLTAGPRVIFNVVFCDIVYNMLQLRADLLVGGHKHVHALEDVILNVGSVLLRNHSLDLELILRLLARVQSTLSVLLVIFLFFDDP